MDDQNVTFANGVRVDKETGEILEIPEDMELSRPTLIVMLNAAYAYREARESADRQYALLVGDNRKPGPLRRYAVEHPDDELADGETGVRLERQERSTGERCDMMQLVKDDPDAVLELARAGLVKLDMTAFKAHQGDFAAADAARRHMLPGGSTLALSVVKDKRHGD